MSLRKDFKNLSTSQKNRRLRKILHNVQNKNIKDECTSIQCTSKSSETNQIHLHEYNLHSNVLNNNDIIESSSESDNDNNSEVSYNNDTTRTSTVINQQETIKFKEQLSEWICEYNISHRAASALLPLLKS